MRIFKNKLVNECVWEAQGCTNESWKEMILKTGDISMDFKALER